MISNLFDKTIRNLYDATIFLRNVFVKETISFFVRKKVIIDGLQIKKTCKVPDFVKINTTLYKLKNMPAIVKILCSSWDILEIKK